MTDSEVTQFDADNMGSGNAPQSADMGGESATSSTTFGPRNIRYTFDKAGNRNNVAETRGSVTTNSPYTPNNLNQYDTAEGVPVQNSNPSAANGFTGDHQIGSYAGVSYTYINDERLASVTSGANTYSLAYDALGRCVKRTLNAVTTYYIYDGEKPIVEYNATGAIAAKNLYGKAIDEILVRTDLSVTPNRVLYYQHDHEGSVTHLTDGSGAVIESYRYDAFGAPTIFDSSLVTRPSSLLGNRFLFTGREYAAPFGIYEYRARAYHPGIGRFTSEDPKLFVRRTGLGKAAGNWTFGNYPDEGELNMFRYCGNDPVDYTDPMGLEIGYDPTLTPEFREQARGWVERVRQADPATVRQLENSPNKHVITKQNNPVLGAGVTTPNNGADATNGRGTGTTIALDPSKATGMSETKDGKLVPTPGSAVTGHEFGHAGEMDKGEAIRLSDAERKNMTPEEIYRHPSERNAVEVEKEVNDLEGLKPRFPDKPSPLPGK